MALLTPTDIANRALQHVGARRIATGALFTENSVNAQEIAACYDGLRRAELRRNVWGKMTRRVILRASNGGVPFGTVVNGSPVYPTLILTPPAWDQYEAYPAGSIVTYNGEPYIAAAWNAGGNIPAEDQSSFWRPYFGPVQVNPFDSTTGYWPGELVYDPLTWPTTIYVVRFANPQVSSTGTNVAPAAPAAWSATVTYGSGDAVTGFVSNVPLNLNNNPAAAPAPWDSGTTYASGDIVLGRDGYLYTSAQSSNTGNDVVNNPTWWAQDALALWVPTPWLSTTGINLQTPFWLQLVGASVSEQQFLYPVGSGPAFDSACRNVFILPAGFLRQAPSAPKEGVMSWLGAPAGLPPDQWEWEGQFIVSPETGPIMLRFVADCQYVPEFDPMFAEGLAARVALEVCEKLTQSGTKLQAISAEYKLFMSEARTVNGIEVGEVLPPLDPYITCRW